MSNDSWSCLMVQNGPGFIPDSIRTTLKAAACGLKLEGKDTSFIENDACSGIITTAWRTHLVGSISGVLFRSQFDFERASDCKVNFLLSIKDLDRGVALIREMEEREPGIWTNSSGKIPVDDLYKFYNLRATSQMH